MIQRGKGYVLGRGVENLFGPRSAVRGTCLRKLVLGSRVLVIFEGTILIKLIHLTRMI